MNNEIYKSPEFIKQLATCGENVQIFKHALILKPEHIHLAHGVRIDDYARIEGGNGLTVGKYTHIASFSSILGGGTTVVGEFAGIAQGARIITGGGHPFWEYFPSPPPKDDYYYLVRDEVFIGNYAFIAANAVVIPGIKIGDGAVVAAGSVVTKDVEPWTVVAGVPARFIKNRPNFING